MSAFFIVYSPGIVYNSRMEQLHQDTIKFINSLVATLRQISIYPAGHPLIVNSIKGVLSSLNIIFMGKKELAITITPEKKLFIDGKQLDERAAPMGRDFALLFEKLGVEDLIFSAGLTEAELDAFIKLVTREDDVKGSDINTLFKELGVGHIAVKQFSYLKVEKGKEAALAEARAMTLEDLKTRVKAFNENKGGGTGAGELEKDMFGVIAAELKEKNKLGASSRGLLKKYLLAVEAGEEAMVRLRQMLVEYGFAENAAGSAVQKISEEIFAPARPRGTRTGTGGFGSGGLGGGGGAGGSGGGGSGFASDEQLLRENEQLKGQMEGLRRKLEEQERLLSKVEKEGRKATDEKHRIDNIIHNLAEGMVVVDDKGKVVLANTAAEALLGVKSGDMVGKPVKEIVGSEHLLTTTKDLTAEKDGVVEKDVEFVSPDESTRKVLRASSAVVEDNNGNTIGMVTMLNDITKQRELEKMKSGFLANVTHELRTPLVAIEKSISLIREENAGVLTETQGQFLAIASRNIKRLSFLINDLLDLAKLEAGRMELKTEAVDMDKLIAENLESLGNWAKTKSIVLAREVQAGLPLVSADPTRLTQVLVNLLGNAIKFSPQNGQITVSAGQADGRILVTVADNGTGIPKEDLSRIFEKFYQTKLRSSSDISGTGIGLAIVKEIVELHGGKVWAESEGNGAKFLFTLNAFAG